MVVGQRQVNQDCGRQKSSGKLWGWAQSRYVCNVEDHALCWFLTAAVTNCPKFCGIKQHKLFSYTSGDQNSKVDLLSLFFITFIGVTLVNKIT